MGDPFTIAAGVGLAVSLYGTVKQSQAQKKAMKSQQQADLIKQTREKRQAIREARIKRGTIEQAGANQGTSGSSAVEGGADSVTSQASSITGFLDQVGAINTNTANALSDASTYGAVAGIGSTIFSASGGFKSIFDADGGGAATKTTTAAAPAAAVKPTSNGITPSTKLYYND